MYFYELITIFNFDIILLAAVFQQIIYAPIIFNFEILDKSDILLCAATFVKLLLFRDGYKQSDYRANVFTFAPPQTANTAILISLHYSEM